MQNLEKMMTRVGNGISQNAAAAAQQVWEALNRVDLSQTDRAVLTGKDYAILHRYIKTVAKKAGVI